MPEDVLRDVTNATMATMREEEARVPQRLSITDPDLVAMGGIGTPATATQSTAGDFVVTAEGLAYLNSKFPALQGISPSMAQKLSFSSILLLNDALVKSAKEVSKQDARQKLATNAEAIKSNPVRIEAGEDNRFQRLHSARFLGGPGCSSQIEWHKARAEMANEGVKAISTYDMDSVGSGGSTTAKGWMEIHNPASPNLKLKQFHMANVGSSSSGTRRISLADGSTAMDVGDSLKEVTELEEFKNALATLRDAMHFALPWNKTIAAIQGFMRISSHCAKDLGGSGDRAKVLSLFVDHVLERNAANWCDGRDFLGVMELTQTWATWNGQRAQARGAQLSQTATYRKSEAQLKFQRKEKPKKKGGNNLCRKFNSAGGCPSGGVGAECKTPFGTVLRHACSAGNGKGGRCEGGHPKQQHT